MRTKLLLLTYVSLRISPMCQHQPDNGRKAIARVLLETGLDRCYAKYTTLFIDLGETRSCFMEEIFSAALRLLCLEKNSGEIALLVTEAANKLIISIFSMNSSGPGP